MEDMWEEIIDKIRRDPKVGYESLTEDQKSKLRAMFRSDVAPPRIKALWEELRYAQKRVERVMYYGQEMILPETPFWETLSAERQKAMLARHEEIENWWNRPSLISFVIYCLTAPLLGVALSVMAWLSSLLVMTFIAVSWRSQNAESLLRRISAIVIIAGLAILAIATSYLRTNWLSALAGLALIGLGSAVVPALFRGLLWYIRDILIKRR